MATRASTQNLIIIAVAVVVAALVAWAGGDGGDRVGSMSVFALCAVLAFALNWLVFVPSSGAQTERYYDLTGGITYVLTTGAAVAFSSELDLRAMLVAGMVLIWALRLSTFLFLRISRAGHDRRFDNVKSNPVRFLLAWTLQALWVVMTAAAAWAVITGGNRSPLGAVGIIGICIWALGMIIEIVADRQKSQFKSDPENDGRFINVGLWSWSRHPNYFGEIVLWIGVAIVAIPVLHGWQWVTLISPVFVAFLLIKGSGIPPLEKMADARWGGQEDYEAYKRRTPVLIPRPPNA